MKGKIIGISGPTVAVDIKGLKLYEQVSVGHAKLVGEVVRLQREQAVIQLYEQTAGLGIGEPAEALGMPLTVRLGPGLLQGIYDGLQRPLEKLRENFGSFIVTGKDWTSLDMEKVWEFHPLKKKGDTITPGETIGYVNEGQLKHFIHSSGVSGVLAYVIEGDFKLNEPVAETEGGAQILAYHDWPVRDTRPYHTKLSPDTPLITGQRIIDFFFPMVRGGTAIFPGGFGTGKTVLEQTITKFADADIVIYVGCGERGNEMADMLGEFGELKDPWTGRSLSERTIMVVNTSNMPVAAREASIYTAASMAEYYRDMGYHVLLLADSISRWAEALREISSALEEMPGEEGYPTQLSSRIASYFARAGMVETLNGETGSVSMILSVSPPGGDFTDPVTQSCLRTTGAFFMMDTSLAHRRHFPAINWAQSFSLYVDEVAGHFCKKVAKDWSDLQVECRELMQREEKLREIAEIVGSEGLQDSDHVLIAVAESINRDFLCQNAFTEDAFSTPEQTYSRIQDILEEYRHKMQDLEKEASSETIDTGAESKE